jgi:cytochrome c551/c552
MPATEDYLRPLPKMHRWFAVSMIVLFLATLLMMYYDHHDEWRAYQHQFFKLQAEKLLAEEAAKKAQLGAVATGAKPTKVEAAYAAKLQEMRDAKAAQQTQLEQAVQDLAEQEENIKKLDNDYTMQMRKVREKRAFRDVARADYDLGIRDQVPEAKSNALLADFTAKQTEVQELEGELDRRDETRNQAAAALKSKTKERDAAVAAIKAFEADILRLETAKDKIEPEGVVKSFKRWLMEQPIIDGFNSHIKVKQDWLPDMKITLGMAKTARFDRCRTCHLAIDLVGAGDVPDYPHGDGTNGTYPHPFSTHPRPDVYLTAASPHPLTEFGCTSCHDGQGSGTSFQNASHTPNDPHQAHEWEHEFKWFNNHFWEYPMQPARLRESACLKCHHSVVELGQNKKFGATAPKVYQGWQLIKKYGCFGCHEINGFDAGKPVGPDLRLEPQTAEEAKKIADDPKAVAGAERKVGPSLKHIASKTTREWLTHWTEEPKRFRPTTNMPQFFHLTNNNGGDGDADGPKFTKVELAAIAHYLFDKSVALEPQKPEEGYQPNAERGETFFAQKGCLACHSHDKDRFKNSHADFGPNLSKVAAKIKPGPEGFNWLYTWIRDPKRHHPNTRMPDLFLESVRKNDVLVDPAADIAAFLLSAGPQTYDAIEASQTDIDALVEMLLWRRKTVTPAQAKAVMSTRKYPIARENVKGDEIELVPETAGAEMSDEEWQRRKMNYLGRVTISRYGCYGCHDIANFETARPIGTALQDWGLKDPSRLAPEHIEEYLHHHGEPDGSSTKARVATAIQKAAAGDFDSHEQKEQELSAAFYYESLLHHGRPGFIWQKLRDPRSYDYEKTSTKFYDERLRMPKFPLNEQEIEAISTFVLGLVARPPAEKFQYRPKGAELAKVEGERLLQKYNCTGCHLIDLPEISYGIKLVKDNETSPPRPDFEASELEPTDHPEALELLLKLKPPRNGLTKKTRIVHGEDGPEKLPVVMFRGLIEKRPDPEADAEERDYTYRLWETLSVDGKVKFPGKNMTFNESQLVEKKASRGGAFAEWLTDDLLKLNQVNQRDLAWQMGPPPLYLEGIKVQTPWLYSFLKNPNQIRHVTVLRMPKFNMSDAEAQKLANYFAAYDDAPFPYQDIGPRLPAYLQAMDAKFHQKYPDRPGDYLQESWRVAGVKLCAGCHQLGGREYKVLDEKKDIRGPNLDQVQHRLRPEWVTLWLLKPSFLTPYTSMPVNFTTVTSPPFAPLMGGNPHDLTVAARDALFNYSRLMEREGKLPEAQAAAPAADEKPAEAKSGDGGAQ